MTLHHTKHHQTYVTALNAAEGSYAKAPTLKERIALQAALKFNGGGLLKRFYDTFLEYAYRDWSGHINHSLFWKNLAPAPAKGGVGGVIPAGSLKTALEQTYGSLDNFKKQFNTTTAGIQGSGWGWLVCFIVFDGIFKRPYFIRVSTLRPRHLKSSPLPTKIHSSVTFPSSVLISGSMRSTFNTRTSNLTSVGLIHAAMETDVIRWHM